jgi:hypothetical protein
MIQLGRSRPSPASGHAVGLALSNALVDITAGLTFRNIFKPKGSASGNGKGMVQSPPAREIDAVEKNHWDYEIGASRVDTLRNDNGAPQLGEIRIDSDWYV